MTKPHEQEENLSDIPAGDAQHLIAVFSDVHSNLEALEAVLADMDKLKIRLRICLGDIVGYGADPGTCVERIRSMDCHVVRGNHDSSACEQPSTETENEEAEDTSMDGIDYARQNLTAEQCEWINSLPLKIEADGFEFVHGSLDTPEQWWYVLSPEDAAVHFEAQTQPICFCGHTHDPMVWQSSDPRQLAIWHGEGRIRIKNTGKTLINVGSVGQPRDRNPDACYAIYNTKARWVHFRRIPYNVQKSQMKIVRAGLPHYSAERLSGGR